MNAEMVIGFVETALSRVDSMYYGGRIEEYMFDNNGVHKKHPKRKKLERYLDRYGERVFCYELYHQVRVIMDSYRFETPERESKITFQGELRKPQIEGVIEYFKDDKIAPLTKEYIPDFLLHSVGNFERQELVLEVKTNPLLTLKDIQNDLIKLQEFISNYKYRKGLFLSVNSSSEVIMSCLSSLRKSAFYTEKLLNKADITFLHKQGTTSPLSKWTLDRLPE